MEPITKFLAHSTDLSRRAAEEMVRAKKVRINGKVAPLGATVDPAKDRVEYGGKIIAARTMGATTVALYKPVGTVTTKGEAEKEAHTVMDLLPKELQHLKPVGRLDKESEGLLLLTDDGDLLYRLTHPKFETEKEYLVEFADNVPDAMIARWKKGVKLPEGMAKADRVERKSRKSLVVVIHQGLNRQLRRMAGQSGASITKLVRTRSGDVKLGTLKPGAWRRVSVPE